MIETFPFSDFLICLEHTIRERFCKARIKPDPPLNSPMKRAKIESFTRKKCAMMSLFTNAYFYGTVETAKETFPKQD